MRPNLADIVRTPKVSPKAGVSEVRQMARPVVSTHWGELLSNTQTELRYGDTEPFNVQRFRFLYGTFTRSSTTGWFPMRGGHSRIRL